MIFIVAYTLIFFQMTLLYFIARRLNKYSIVDIGFGMVFVFTQFGLLIYQWISGSSISIPQIVMTVMITLWGLRLSLHIFKRAYKKPEDFRYQAMKDSYKKYPRLQAFFKIFMFQGLMIAILSTAPLMPYFSSTEPNIILWIVGITVFMIGLTFEATADSQLKKFIQTEKSPENPFMKKGLWAYSRHPNYFGESLLWWGISISVITLKYGFIGIISALLMTLLVRYISGVPLLEKKYELNPLFEIYKKQTSIFIPLPKKKVI